MPIKIPTVQTGLEASIQAAAKKAGRNLKINMGGNAKSIEGLSQPLGRITGKADQFTKSMEAANARVLAFGASVGILSAVTRGFKELIKVTIDVEKSLTSINSILNVSTRQLESFKNTIFDVARNTEQSFSTVAQAALELSRQGLKAEEVTSRLNDALILSRLSGLGASEAVAGLTAAINSFNKAGLSSSQVLNKLSAAAVSAAVSEKDLIEGIKRSGSVATQAGVSFDELVGVITAVQAKTARGGAVIGNSFKTIFTRIQSIDKLKTMQNLGVEVTDASGQVLGATKLIQNLAKSLEDVPDARRLQIAEGLVGKFQVAPFLAILDDYISKTSRAIAITEVSQNATSQAYDRNEAQNATLSAAINRTTQSVAQFAEALGKIGVTDNLKSLLGFFSSVIEDITGLFDGDSLGAKFAKGIVAGIGNIITGPGLAVFIAIIGKLAIDLVRFGAGSLKTFFGLNKAAQQQATLQGQIASTLLSNSGIQKQILAIENSTLSVGQKRAAQTAFFTTALNEQLLVMTRMQSIASRIAPGVMRGTSGGGRAAGGFIPNYNAIVGYGSEKSDISKGVGGAPTSARPVTIPNFNFGGGQKGSMVANSSEYIVPNYAGGDGSAIFNQDMAASIGLPSGAKKIGAAGGYIPNFATKKGSGSKTTPIEVPFAGLITPRKRGGTAPKIGKFGDSYYRFPTYGIDSAGEKARETEELTKLVREYSISKAREESKFMTGGDPLAANIIKLSNQGSIGSLAGSIFETALSSLVKSPEFDMGETGTFDFIGAKAVDNISQLSPSLKGSKVNFLEAKISDESRHLNSMAKKIVTYFGPSAGGKNITGFARGKLIKGAEKSFSNKKNTGSLNVNNTSTGNVTDNLNRAIGLSPGSQGVVPKGPRDPRGASGYIPNFAGSLQDSIARESAAGLPINQIRINQNPRLRNAGNPMGLAVTNTRDEPTGAIPNFAKKATPDQATDAMGGFVGKLFVVQMAMGMLSGIMGEVTEKNKAVSASLTLLNIAVTAAMTAQAFGGFGAAARGVGSFATGSFGKSVVAKGQGIVQKGLDASNASKLIAGGSNAGMLAKRGVGLQVTGALTKVGGALLRFAGPVGVAATAAFAISKALDWTSGRSALAAEQTKSLGESAKIAADKLAKLKVPEEFKKKLQTSATQQADAVSQGLGRQSGGLRQGILDAREITANNISEGRRSYRDLFDSSGLGQIVQAAGSIWQSSTGDITGSDDDGFRKRMNDSIVGARKVGVSSQFVTEQQNVMEKARTDRGGENEQIDALREGAIFIDSMQRATKNFNAGKIINQITASLPDGVLTGIRETDKVERDAKNDGRKLSQKELNAKKIDITSILEALEEAKKSADPESLAMMKMISKSALIEGVKLKTNEGTAKQDIVNKIRGDTGKNEIKAAIDMAKLRAKELSSNEKLLENDKFRNQLSNVRKATLSQEIALEKISVATNVQIADLIKAEVGSLEAMDFSLDEQKMLKYQINELTLEQLTTEGEIERLVNSTLDLDGKKTMEKEALIEKLKSEVAILRDKEAIEKRIETRNRAPANQNVGNAESLSARVAEAKRKIKKGELEKGSVLKNNVMGQDFIDATRDPNLNPTQKGEAQLESAKRRSALTFEGVQDKAIADTKRQLIELYTLFPLLERRLQPFIDMLDKEGTKAIPEIGVELNAIGTGIDQKTGKPPIPFSPTSFQQLENDEDRTTALAAADTTAETLRGIEVAKKAAANAIEIAKHNRDIADGFKPFSILLEDFVFSLRQSAEDLKMGLLTARDSGSIISNIDDQIAIKDAKTFTDPKMGTAIASDNVALRSAGDKITLARTSVGRRAATKERDILAEQLKLKTEESVLAEDEITNAERLLKLRFDILKLEKEKSEIGTSRAELFKNAFVFDPKEIQEGLDIALVENAKTFVNTISDGLVDAISKGQDLGDTLRQAGAEFFNKMAKANMDAAFKNIQSSSFVEDIGSIFGFAAGGKVTGGSGSKDDVPALLMDGEFVMRKSSVQKYGPNFMESLNSGKIPAMAKGGLFTPGTYGQEEIRGKNNLLDFATQSFTAGNSDRFGSGSGFASVGLEPQSAALTMFGRRNSPAFQREQDSKQKAFGLFSKQVNKEEQAKEQKKKDKKAFWDSLGAAAAATGFKSLTDLFGPKADLSKASQGLDITKTRFTSQRPTFPSSGSSLKATASTWNPLEGLDLVDLTSKTELKDFGASNDFRSAGWSGLPEKKATGGAIPNAAGVDTVPSMLSGGEFVMNAAATQKIGAGNLNALNSGASGGSEDVVSKLDELISVSDNAGETVINITVNSDGSSDSQGNGDDQQTSLATKIKDVVKQVIDDEKRLGGSLRQARA
jgi:TP901 family phage tail tape measure protein